MFFELTEIILLQEYVLVSISQYIYSLLSKDWRRSCNAGSMWVRHLNATSSLIKEKVFVRLAFIIDQCCRVLSIRVQGIGFSWCTANTCIVISSDVVDMKVRLLVEVIWDFSGSSTNHTHTVVSAHSFLLITSLHALHVLTTLAHHFILD